MKQHILAASLATFFTLGLGQAAFAAAQGAGSENVEKMRIFKELDADGDGSLTQAELAQGGKLRFAKADKNKDGFCRTLNCAIRWWRKCNSAAPVKWLK